MKQLLFKNRIRGVSFHRIGGAVPRSQGATKGYAPLGEQAFRLTQEELARGRPAPLLPRQIRRLLEDTQRHELHALVTDCIEHLSHWKQLSQALDNYFGAASHFLDLEEVESNMVSENDQVSLAVEVRSNFLLWKHRLAVLELIAEAHPFLGYENLYAALSKPV